MLINFHQPKKMKNIDKTQVVLQQNIVHTVLASKINRIFDYLNHIHLLIFITYFHIIHNCYLLIKQDDFEGDNNNSNESDGDHGHNNSNIIQQFL